MSSPTIAGKYELLRRLGKGGMAEVFLAKQKGLDGFEKLVVIKRILPHLAAHDDFVTMFLDEARTAADLRHPNVVNIFEIGEDQGTYYMVMEFLHGQDIRKIQRKSVQAGVEVPLQHALQIIIDAANGLYHAHMKKDLSGQPLNIIHRDISPQNIITTYDGATKIVDFGIAKATSQTTETQTGVVKGKYTYMAPEQACGEVLDHRTDQFALGIVMWELVTMRRLFKRENELLTLAAITEGDVPRPSEFVDIPKRLDDIIMRVLAKDREDRFTDCQQMMLALEDFLVDARLPHSPARLGVFMKELFADTIKEESELGVGQLDGQSITGVSQADRTAVGRKGRRDSGVSSKYSLRAAVEAEAGESAAEARTAMSISGLNSQTVDESETPPTSATGTAGRPMTVTGGPTGVGPHDPGSPKMAIAAGLAIALCLVLLVPLWWVLSSMGDAVGEIVVRTEPEGASVFVNGSRQAERTPMVVRGVPVGEVQTIRVKKDGYEEFSFSASVSTEGASTELDTTLTKLDEDAADPPPQKDEPAQVVKDDPAPATPEPEPAAKEDPPPKKDEPKHVEKKSTTSKKTVVRREPKKDKRPGKLTVSVKPWAKVYINGEYHDTTPFPALELAPGTYSVKLVNTDLKKSVTRKVTIKPGKTKLIKLTL